jgi:hypothetical protein
MILKLYEVEGTDEFVAWYRGLGNREHAAVTRAIDRLELYGHNLPYPHSSKIKGSRHGAMRELRILVAGRAIRVLYLFDPRRVAVLLTGGTKTGTHRFYEQIVPEADQLYDHHLADLRREGAI